METRNSIIKGMACVVIPQLKDTMQKILVIISSKNPKKYLIDNITGLYNIQFSNNNDNVKICIIDSDSDKFESYEIIKNKFPLVELHFIQNKNYEYGAYKYAYSQYPDYDIYFCIQDSLIIQKKVDITCVNDLNAFTCHDKSGFHSHPEIKNKGIELLRGCQFGSFLLESRRNIPWIGPGRVESGHKSIKLLRNCYLEYNMDIETFVNIIDGKFPLAQHSTFIVSNVVMKDIFKTFINPPIDKEGSCCFERLFGLYFIVKKIRTVDVRNHFYKIHGSRNGRRR